jgi:hypothetical protein
VPCNDGLVIGWPPSTQPPPAGRGSSTRRVREFGAECPRRQSAPGCLMNTAQPPFLIQASSTHIGQFPAFLCPALLAPQLTIDCRRSRPHCLISLRNTVTGMRLAMETVPRANGGGGGGGSARGGARGAGGGRQRQQQQNGAAVAGAAAGAAGEQPPRAAGAAAAPAANGNGAHNAPAQEAAGADGGGGDGAAARDGGVGQALHSTLSEWVLVVGLSRTGEPGTWPTAGMASRSRGGQSLVKRQSMLALAQNPDLDREPQFCAT